MLELLRDNESIPLPSQQKPLEAFNLDSASEQDLRSFLLSTHLQKFSEFDLSLESFESLKIFSQDTLDYFKDLFPQHKQFSKDQTETLLISHSSTYTILSLTPSLQTLDLFVVNDEASSPNLPETITQIISTLLHWLWLRLNSY